MVLVGGDSFYAVICSEYGGNVCVKICHAYNLINICCRWDETNRGGARQGEAGRGGAWRSVTGYDCLG